MNGNRIQTIFLIGVVVMLAFGAQYHGQQINAKKHHKNDSLREENQRLQDQINAMKQIQGRNVILPNGSSVAFSQLPPETQSAMLNNSALINANIPVSDNNSSSSHHTKHHDTSTDSNNNPLADVGRKLKKLFD